MQKQELQQPLIRGLLNSPFPTCFTSAFVLHLSTASIKSSGKSILKICGKICKCLCTANGLIPGIIGTEPSLFWQQNQNI
jgi:hypothetical protein